jgi:hypothetical protein
MGTLSSELREWIVPGLAGAIATVDPDGQPRLARVWAAWAREASDVIDIYVHSSNAHTLARGLAGNGRAALSLIDVPSYRSRLFKGPCVASGIVPDLATLDRSLAALDRAFSRVGMPSDVTQRMLAHSDAPRSMAVFELTVESVFDQSPKPGAGALIACVR